MEADRCEIIVEPEYLENSLPNAMQVEKTTTFTLTASTIIGSGIRKDWSAAPVPRGTKIFDAILLLFWYV